MTGRDFAFSLVLAAGGAIGGMLSQPATARAAESPVRIECPRTLPDDAVTKRQRRDGWTQAVPGEHSLSDWGVLTGAPDEQAYLMPDRPGAKPDSERWSFYTPHGYQHWVYCKYGPVLLARRISPAIKECVGTVGKTSKLMAFLCK